MKTAFSIKRFIAIIRKEFIQIKRDPISLRLPIAMPVLMMLLFGYAVNTEVDRLPTVIFDQSKTEQSREYVAKFAASDYFVPAYNVTSEKELTELIDSGQAKAGIIIPSDYAEMIKSQKSPTTQLVIDGTNPTTARTAMNSGLLISEYYSRSMGNSYLLRKGFSGTATPGVSINTKVWYNPNLDSNRFTIPGLIGLILQNITVMLTAFALVREKERCTIEQLIVTPIKSIELILGKLVPYIFIGYAGFLFTLILNVLWFKVNIEGSLPLLLLLGGIFVICSLAMGMMISTFARNQLQAMMVSILLILPSVLLSGFIFPREAMPGPIYILSALLPLTYFLDIVRGIVLKGVSVEYLWWDIGILTAFTVGILAIAILRFKKSLD